MPVTNKSKTKKQFLIDILREPYVTKEDANILFDRIREECIEALSNGQVVNLFDLVLLEAVDTKEKIYEGFMGGDKLVIPQKTTIKASPYRRLKREWKDTND